MFTSRGYAVLGLCCFLLMPASAQPSGVNSPAVAISWRCSIKISTSNLDFSLQNYLLIERGKCHGGQDSSKAC